MRLTLSLFLLGLSLMLAACSSDQLLAAYLETNRTKLDQPASTMHEELTFVVEPGTPARTIAENLAARGLINDARLFEAYVRTTGITQQLEAGTFTLSPDMTPMEIAQALQNAYRENTTVTIPEGWRLEQVADALSDGEIVDGEEYLRLATQPGWLPNSAEGVGAPWAFVSSRPADASLEGYLFPDTYQLDVDNATAEELLRRQLEAFAQKALPLYQSAVESGSTTLSLHEVLTLASIVEREAVVADERPLIARVYLNRLAIGMRLEADPTVQYAMGYQPESKQWWKSPVFLEEYSSVISPYNTYLNAGLPPGPIAAPGIGSIEAVLTPAQHDDLFFVALPDGSGRHAFSRTLAEHLENVRRYRGE
jgi:UPF0755 protein